MVPLTPLLSVIVPVFNEERTIEKVLETLTRVPYRYPEQQIVVVDDGSTDSTAALVRRWSNAPGFTVLRHTVNQGKGAAFRTGLAHATGAITVIQDADLEVDPAELPWLIAPILRRECTVTYGSRFLGAARLTHWNGNRFGVEVMNWLAWAVNGIRLTDVAACYKVLPTELYRRLDLQAERFELCAEITTKLCRLQASIKEVPIAYYPRTRQEGKKIFWWDGFLFAWTLFAWRFRTLQMHSDEMSFSKDLRQVGEECP
jgi:glycosyltransferase involved in cell wall biosynthesis